tara:strand:+ start:4102 stop:5445 length:1344 start_codon:yes stop_codon:yes gene_type:complete
MSKTQEALDDILDSVVDEMGFENPDLTNISSDNEDEKEDMQELYTPEMPSEFPGLMRDFVNDILTTFPEYGPIIAKWWSIEGEEVPEEQSKTLFAYCLNVYPGRFTDIIYKDETIFKSESSVNVDFLPGISFKYLWFCDGISDQTRDTLWKYLQMVVLSVISTSDTKNMSTEMKQILSCMDENSFKEKLGETINDIQKVFEESGTKEGSEESTPDIQDQLNGLMSGKLGQIAQEIAEETTKELDMGEFDGTENVGDIFSKVFQNPGKLMSLVKDVSTKLESKINSGDLQQQELMSEATGLLQNMKDMPGMENIQSMLNSTMRRQTAREGFDESGGETNDLTEMMAGLMGTAGRNRGGVRTTVDGGALDRNARKTNQITQMKKRIEKKKMQDAIALQNALKAAEEQKNAPRLTDEEIAQLIEEDENDNKKKEAGKKSQQKKKKAKNKK